MRSIPPAPVYLRTFVESFRLAVTSTLLIALIGYPFGYFMAKLRGRWKQAAMMPSPWAPLAAIRSNRSCSLRTARDTAAPSGQ